MKWHKSKLKLRLKEILKFFAKIFATELVKYWIIPILGFSTLAYLLLSALDFLSSLLQTPIVPLPEKLLAYHLLLIVLIVALFYTLYRFIKNKFFAKYFFMEEHGFKWKVNKQSQTVEKAPYCPEHQVKLKLIPVCGGYVAAGIKYNIYCQICGKYLYSDFPKETLIMIFGLVIDKYDAIRDKHNKGF